ETLCVRFDNFRIGPVVSFGECTADADGKSAVFHPFGHVVFIDPAGWHEVSMRYRTFDILDEGSAKHAAREYFQYIDTGFHRSDNFSCGGASRQIGDLVQVAQFGNPGVKMRTDDILCPAADRLVGSFP